MGRFSELQTCCGFALDEVASALQKSVRRGLTDDSLYWCTELELSGYGQYAWKRLVVIASEDVGPAWPEGPAVIRALFEEWRSLRSVRNSPARLFLAHATILLARAPKSRIADTALSVHLIAHHDLRRGVPDYALDMHTTRGREMHRGYRHFFEEGARVEPEIEDPEADRYAEMERVLHRLGRRAPPLPSPYQPDEPTLFKDDGPAPG